jgi:hypothetical protein
MKLTWYLNDGYVGTKPFTATIDDTEIEACETEEEYNELIENYVQESFNQRVSFYYTAPPFVKKLKSENEDY